MPHQTLVMICGLASDEAIWDEQVARLAGEASCLPVVPRGDSIETMARELLGRLPARFSLVGHSMGGYVALALAELAPERVERLALVNSSAEADSPEQQRSRQRLIRSVEAHGLAQLTPKLAANMIAPTRADAPQLVERITALLDRTGEVWFLENQRAITSRPDRLDYYRRLQLPLLVIGGRDDRVVPALHSERMHEANPRTKFLLLDGCGHMGPWEAPAEVTEALREWLAAPPIHVREGPE